ncbi:TetR/AcrR family transcriptional regulator [Candidatus Binatus sp.]|uniref:TetR/AcrR family transcriptional regulator n=1 Tax=Candidatus Binatus sp. TaxID=2811406 RepID=UPI003BAEBC7C
MWQEILEHPSSLDVPYHPMAKTSRKRSDRTVSQASRAIPKQERSRERVAAILAATARLLAKSGFDGLNTRQIAAAAKLPPGLLYHYFPNKGAIVMLLAEQNVQPLRQELAQMLSAAKATSWREAIRRLIGKLAAAYRAEPAAMAILQALQSDPELRRLNGEMNNQFARIIAKFLRAAGARVDSRTLLRAAHLVVLLCDAVAPDLVAASPREAEKLSAEISTLLIAYLGMMLQEHARGTDVSAKPPVARAI